MPRWTCDDQADVQGRVITPTDLEQLARRFSCVRALLVMSDPEGTTHTVSWGKTPEESGWAAVDMGKLRAVLRAQPTSYEDAVAAAAAVRPSEVEGTVLHRLEHWQHGGKGRTVRIDHDDGYGSSVGWEVELVDRGVGRVCACGSERPEGYEGAVVWTGTEDDDWPVLSKVVEAALAAWEERYGDETAAEG